MCCRSFGLGVKGPGEVSAYQLAYVRIRRRAFRGLGTERAGEIERIVRGHGASQYVLSLEGAMQCESESCGGAIMAHILAVPSRGFCGSFLPEEPGGL